MRPQVPADVAVPGASQSGDRRHGLRFDVRSTPGLSASQPANLRWLRLLPGYGQPVGSTGLVSAAGLMPPRARAVYRVPAEVLDTNLITFLCKSLIGGKYE